jgi:endonuclease/exonuclease/phosphatase (EEP) superfamily protein YafD
MKEESPSPKTYFNKALMGWMIFISAVVTLLTLLSYLGRLHWLIELITPFRMQFLVLSVICLLYFAIMRKKRALALLLVPFALNSLAVLHWYTGGDSVDPLAPSFKILLANVNTANKNHQLLLDLIEKENPDLIVVEELSSHWKEALSVLDETYPHQKIITRSDSFGIGVYSRLKPGGRIMALNLGHSGVPSLSFELNLWGQRTTLLATHPLPPISRDYHDRRNQQITAIGDFVLEHSGPLIVIGDLNASMWSSYYEELIERTALKNARKGHGILPTWPNGLSPLKIPIDHCLLSEDFAVKEIHVGPDIRSDHYPLIIQIVKR